MSKEQAFDFLMGADEALVEKLSGATHPAAALIEAAAEAGHAFSGEDLAGAIYQAEDSGELSEEQLEQVAGGVPYTNPVGQILTILKSTGGDLSIPGSGPLG